jgi:8-hydroxy-5-deazaflavin:NADPH oxidoreductase
MSYAIVGFGKIGQALAHAFARNNINVTVASRRPPEALAPQARGVVPTVVAKSLRDALKADTIILAIPFGTHHEVAKALPSWKGKTVIDAMNSFPLPPEELDGLPSSTFIAKSFTGAKVVKGFNHLGAATLASDPVVEGGHRVIFCRVMMRTRSLPSQTWRRDLNSPLSFSESLMRAACWCTHGAASGDTSSSRTCSRSSNSSSTA